MSNIATKYFGDKTGSEITAVVFTILSGAAVLAYYLIKTVKENNVLKSQIVQMQLSMSNEQQTS